MYLVTLHHCIKRSVNHSSISLDPPRLPGGQAVQDRPGQHPARAGPGPVQQEVRRGTGHQVSRPSALQADQEQPGLGHHRGPAARHSL